MCAFQVLNPRQWSFAKQNIIQNRKGKRSDAVVWQTPLNDRQCIGEMTQTRYKYVRLHNYNGPTYDGQLGRQQDKSSDSILQ